MAEKKPGVHLFEGTPDGRQSDDVAMPTSRFRERFRALLDSEKSQHDGLKAKAREMEALIDALKPGRYRSLAITALEECVMWAVKGLTE